MEGGIAERVAGYPGWYHRIDLGGGVVTPGMWDVGRTADRLPWPDVRGKRCLDIGTADGFFAFELERRGAREVVAIDIANRATQADLSWEMRRDPLRVERDRGPKWKKGGGFEIAHAALRSKVEWRPMTIYELSPDVVGTFDVVTCGSLLLHLRDPILALEAVRSVCGGLFMSADAIDPWLTVMIRRTPVARFRGYGLLSQWWNVNAAGHVAWVEAAGFEVLKRTKAYVVPWHEAPRLRTRALMAERQVIRILARTWAPGVLHQALLAQPRQD